MVGALLTALLLRVTGKQRCCVRAVPAAVPEGGAGSVAPERLFGGGGDRKGGLLGPAPGPGECEFTSMSVTV